MGKSFEHIVSDLTHTTQRAIFEKLQAIRDREGISDGKGFSHYWIPFPDEARRSSSKYGGYLFVKFEKDGKIKLFQFLVEGRLHITNAPRQGDGNYYFSLTARTCPVNSKNATLFEKKGLLGTGSPVFRASFDDRDKSFWRGELWVLEREARKKDLVGSLHQAAVQAAAAAWDHSSWRSL